MWKSFVYNSLLLILMGGTTGAMLAQSLTFSSERGFYTKKVKVKLTPSTKGNSIWYTQDGSIPSPENGTSYVKPIEISQSSSLRAQEYDGSGTPVGLVVTHSYLFLDQILQQPDSIRGWDRPQVYTHYRGFPVKMDYEMDPEIVDNSQYSQAIRKGFEEIPSVVLALPQTDFWDVSLRNEEVVSSIEILYPDDKNAHEAAIAELEGISHKLLKRSYRMAFKKKHGNSRFNSQVLKKTAPIHAKNATGKFDQLVLRGGTQRCWARRWYPDQTAYTRDQWYRDSQIDVSGFGPRGTFAHLFVNGIYMGLYNLTERPDEAFAGSYFKGKDDDWFAFNHNGVLEGDASRLDYLTDTLMGADFSIGANYEKLGEYVDLSEFCEYLIVCWICGMVDWPENNYYGGYNATLGGGLKFFGWDAEMSWDDQDEAHPGAWVHYEFAADEEGESLISELWHRARQNPDFLMLFADKVYEHCFGEGALTDEAQKNRWKILNDFIYNPMVAESARWGDALEDTLPPRTRNEHWMAEVQRVDSMMNGNVERFIQALREEGYYPEIDPPTVLIAKSGKQFQVSCTNPNEAGEIWYHEANYDPRASGGEVAQGAQVYQSPFTVEPGASLRFRIKLGDIWSAVHKTKVPKSKN